MKRPNSRKTLFLILIILAGCMIAARLRQGAGGLASSQQEKLSADKNDKEKMPLVVFSASQPGDAKEQSLRKARGVRYDGRLQKPLNELDGTGMIRVTHWWVNLPGLPTSQSDAVILGEVVEANAYLSNDRTNVYSEFDIRIEEIFKDESGGSLVKGGTLTTSREGGRAQLPDGRILYVMSSDQSMPRKERRYLLFLKRNNEPKDYNIITGYMLYQNKVALLDEIDLDRFAIYKNMTEGTFLNAVREAIANPPQAPRDIER
jgi:hypothetical protein